MSNTARNFCLIQAHSTNNIQLHFFVCLVFHNIYNVYTVTRKPKFPLLDCTRGGPSKQHKLVEHLCIITILVWFSSIKNTFTYTGIYYPYISLTKSRQNPMNSVDTVTNHTYPSLNRLINHKFITIHSNKYIHGLQIQSQMKTFICASMHFLKIYVTSILQQCCNVENGCIILYCTKFFQKHLQFFTIQHMYS